MNRQQKIHKTYVIALTENSDSMFTANRAVESCNMYNMPVEIWSAFDGTKNNKIKVPDHLINQQHFNFLKVLNFKLITAEIAVWLSHYSL